MYKVLGFTFLFSPVIREDSHFGRICFKLVETTTWVQNTFEDDAKENIMFETFDWILISHQLTSVSLKYGVVPYRSYRTFWGGDILGWLSVDHYPMFVQMLQMTCLGEGWLFSLKYLTWKYDSPRCVSFHKPKQQFNKESPPFLFPFSKVLFGITDETREIHLDFIIFIPRCFTTRSGSMNMQLTWRIRIVIHWAFVCSMVFRNAIKGPTSDGRNRANLTVRVETRLKLWRYFPTMNLCRIFVGVVDVKPPPDPWVDDPNQLLTLLNYSICFGLQLAPEKEIIIWICTYIYMFTYTHTFFYA